jgi:hypothetical protein
VNGLSGKVFRAPARDRHGDPVDELGNPVDMVDEDGLAFVGEIKRIVVGALSASPSRRQEETTDTSGMIGCPKKSAVRLAFGDRIDINGTRYQVVSKPEWDYSQVLTGSTFGYYWVDVRGADG